MKIKSISFTLFALITVLLTSCTPEDVSFDSSLLIGKWSRDYQEDNVTKTEYYRYDSDGTGVSWVPADDVSEAEGQGFQWVLDKSDLTQIYLMEVSGATVTKIYTVTQLNSTTLQYKDDLGTTYTFTKVQ